MQNVGTTFIIAPTFHCHHMMMAFVICVSMYFELCILQNQMLLYGKNQWVWLMLFSASYQHVCLKNDSANAIFAFLLLWNEFQHKCLL